jgi:3-oxoadipate enol-lactonase
MPFVDHAGCRLRYEVDGTPDGPALLFSNSLGTTVQLWEPQIPALSPYFRIIRYDTRGHGASEAPEGPYALDTLGLDAIAVLDAVAVDRAHVCGLSLGGLTAMWLAVHQPGRIQSIVLASTAARIGTTTMWEERIAQVRASGVDSLADAAMGRWFTQDFRSAHPDIVAAHHRMLSETSPIGYAACCAAIRDADLRFEIGAITAPTLVIAGHHDPVTPPSDAEVMRAKIPTARVALLDGAHIINVEQAAAFNAQLSAFFTEQRTWHG